ncbi:DUF3987 domain-containing protein [Roseomonas sp. KE2513]|uniref:DUF3987 domain-containing protein n=1 Tax=Roseomonas sp. KE2513 TaxID=2479202 RepID=UPI0018DF8D1E|nr:DUF3987 domain-containing protein [Roseomonas sp. KE2513]MBI0535090.1 DUF3987 domain-containing protein [Roseomonas sp. KE2513]
MDGSTGRHDFHPEAAAAAAVKAAPWPATDVTPATADTLPAPPLPLALFPGAWPDWIGRAAEVSGAPADYVACALIAAAGAMIGNARWGEPRPGWREPPILNVALVGNPSSGKSPALSSVTSPLGQMEAEDNADLDGRCADHRRLKQAAKEHRALWEAEVRAAVKGGTPPPSEPKDARDPEEPTARRFKTSDPTREAVRDLAAANPRGLLLIRDELAGWIAGMDRYGSGGGGGADRAFYLEAWNGAEHVADRVKDRAEGRRGGTVIPHLTVGILGGIQPDRVASLLLSGDDDGLAARFLYTWPDPAPISDNDVLAGDLFTLAARRLRDLDWKGPHPVLLPFTAQARADVLAWRREVRGMEAGAGGAFLSWLGKLPGFGVRLAVVFAHLAWTGMEGASEPTEVTEDDTARALAFLADYAVPMARRVFGEAALPQAERDARTLARWYLRQPVPRPETLNARGLRRMGNGPGLPNAERIGGALAELAELGWVRPDPTRAGEHAGRSRGDWRVNPGLQRWRK